MRGQRQQNRRAGAGRPWVRGVAVALVVALAVPAAAVLPGGDGIAFHVFRDQQPIGRHEIAFRQEGEDLHVEIAIDLEVSFAFITVFRYEHRNHEVWRDGRLVALDTRTDDDGTAYRVRARATDAGLAVEGSGGSYLAPADIIPTSYWNMATVAQSALLDTQRGRILTVAVLESGEDGIAVDGEPVSARRFAMRGDLDLDLWYGPSDELVKLAFEARGASIDYERKPPSPDPVGTVQTGRNG